MPLRANPVADPPLRRPARRRHSGARVYRRAVWPGGMRARRTPAPRGASQGPRGRLIGCFGVRTMKPVGHRLGRGFAGRYGPPPQRTPRPTSALVAEAQGYYTSPDPAVAESDPMLELLNFISSLITLYIYIIIAGAVMSWLIAFNVVNPYNQFVRSIWQGLNALTEPLLRPIRRWMPDLGGIDISPVVLILACCVRAERSCCPTWPSCWCEAAAARAALAQRPGRGQACWCASAPKSAREGVDGMVETRAGAGAHGAGARRRRRRARRTGRWRGWWRSGWAWPRAALRCRPAASRASRRSRSRASPPGWRR